MKKIIALLLTVLTAVTLFCSCGEKAVSLYQISDYSKIIAVGSYKGLEFPLSSSTMQNKILAQYHSDMTNANLVESTTLTSGVVQTDDTVNIDYVGKKDGVAFEGGTAEGASLTIGSGQFIPGFEDGLIGQSIGSTVVLNLSFPDEYTPNPDLAGKPVEFTVKINSASRPIYPELTEKYETMAHELGYEDLAAYKKAVEETVKNNYIWGEMVVGTATVMTYPERELQLNVDYYTKTMQSYSAYTDATTLNGYIEEAAKGKTKEELVCHYIAQKENIKVPEEDIKTAAQNNYGSDYTEAEYYEVENKLICQKAVQFVIDSTITK